MHPGLREGDWKLSISTYLEARMTADSAVTLRSLALSANYPPAGVTDPLSLLL